ncbi:MAG: hypothetical protein E7649_07865 [Ruminococcaceae bacterium]|nr:hypothetical protein [Oscillospiraceae bacterium]
MSGSSYVQSYSGFVGVDFTSDPACVARNRLAHSVNMWRDYDSENGAAIETFPGFRTAVGLADECGEILKVYHFKAEGKDYLIIHATRGIFAVDVANVATEAKEIKLEDRIDLGVSEEYSRSLGFYQNNRLYIICDNRYYCVVYGDSSFLLMRVNVDITTRVSVSGKWRLNETIIIESNQFWNVEFENNGSSFEAIQILNTDIVDGVNIYTLFYYPKDGYEISVYNSTKKTWESDEYRTIDFGSAVQQVDATFYEWLLNNAVRECGEKQENTFKPYIPTTYYNGKPYEQRNMLINQTCQLEINGGVESGGYVHIPLLEKCEYGQYDVYIDDQLTYDTDTSTEFENGVSLVKNDVYDEENEKWKQIKIVYTTLDPIKFNTIEEGKHRSVASLEYGGTSVDAILGCTKAAVYDGRVFLTGNPALPNTVFYSARNSTGANDPTYFGVYNYFNDGYGNTPNVDMLSTPSMLMVIKRDTVQDGSIYYHQGTDNTDEDSKNLIPRIYPSTSGAAGIGSVGTLESRGVLSCNFLDDMVLLTKRGLDGVSKEAVNLERTIGHRSTCVDKLLLREDLSAASMTEWKGYLVICCNGHIYLADSRSMTQHRDGSYQYEWFYLEGLVTRGKDRTYVFEDKIPDGYRVKDVDDVVDSANIITEEINGVLVCYVKEGDYKYLVEPQGWEPSDNKIWDVLAIGDLLLLISDKNVCIVNTDMERDEYGRLTAEAYSFDGCGYVSGCATRLDDCGRVTTRKNTIFGMVVARFKTMIGSRCSVKSSTDGRSFDKLCDVDNNRNDWDDLDYGNATYDIDADHVAVIPERSRGWVRKQYYFYSDGFRQPFGLYEMSYHYNTVGRIRR